jgi:hypothetical protein
MNEMLSKMNSNQDSKINGISQEISKVNQEVSQKLSKVTQEVSQELSKVSQELSKVNQEVSQKLSNVSQEVPQEVLQEVPQEVLQELSKAPAPGSGSRSTPAPVPPSVPNDFEKHVNLLAIAAYNTIRDKFTSTDLFVENMQKHLYITGFSRTTHYKTFALQTNELFSLLFADLPFRNKYKNIDIITAIKESLMRWKSSADKEEVTLEQFLSGNNLEDLSMRFGELNPNDNFYPPQVLKDVLFPRGSPSLQRIMIIDNPSAESYLEEAIKGT